MTAVEPIRTLSPLLASVTPLAAVLAAPPDAGRERATTAIPSKTYSPKLIGGDYIRLRARLWQAQAAVAVHSETPQYGLRLPVRTDLTWRLKSWLMAAAVVLALRIAASVFARR